MCLRKHKKQASLLGYEENREDIRVAHHLSRVEFCTIVIVPFVTLQSV